MNVVSAQELNDQSVIPGSKGTIGHDYIRGFLKGAVLHGYSPEKILKKANIPVSVYSDPTAHIDGLQFQRLIWIIQAEMNDIFMGFLEQPGKPGLDREQARVRFQCKTLGEALIATTEFREAVRNDINYNYLIDERQQEFTLKVHYKTCKEVDTHLCHWHRLIIIYKYYCWLVGKRIKLNRVCVTAPQPATDEGLDCYGIFNCDIRFMRADNALTFDKKYLQYPIVRVESEQLDFVEGNPDWFTIAGDDDSMARQVQQVVIRLQRENIWSPSAENVAGILNMSTRTMRRQLSRENETFQGIKSRMRRDMAIKLLLTTDIPITSISNDVGFAEPGDFTRAFIGWTGGTPSAYRASHDEQNAETTDIHTYIHRSRQTRTTPEIV